MQNFESLSRRQPSEDLTPDVRHLGPVYGACYLCVCRANTFSRRSRSAAATTGRNTDATVKRPYNDDNPDDHWFDSVDRRGHCAVRRPALCAGVVGVCLSTALENLAFFEPCDACLATDIKPLACGKPHASAQSVRPRASRDHSGARRLKGRY